MRPGCGANHTEHKQQNAMRSLCFGIFLMTSMLGLLHGLLTENLLPFSLLFFLRSEVFHIHPVTVSLWANKHWEGIWASQVALVVKNPPTNTGEIRDTSLIPGGGHCNPLQYSCLGNPMDRGAWQTRVHGVPKSQTQLKNQHTYRGSLVSVILTTFSSRIFLGVCVRWIG